MEENNPSEDVPQEDKPQEKKTHYVVDFLKDVNWQRFKGKSYNFYSTCKNGWKKHKDTIIIQFFVALVAVLIAFRLAGCHEQKALDKVTRQRLHLTYLESQYNATYAKNILDIYADENNFGISINRLDTTAATAAFRDSNISSIIPLHKISLLRSYVNSILTLNQSLQIHQGVI